MPDPTILSPRAEELAAAFHGELIEPGDADYEEARAVWNGMFDRHPALIARCADSDDVVAAVDLGRSLGVAVAVRGGGHSAAGHGTCDGGLVIDLSAMKGITLDPAARTVRAEAGLTWGEFDRETQKFGLAVTGGRFSTTGIAGLTLGSGSGWIERKCGLTADNLIAAEVVTADGRAITASPDMHPELFWGLRGGGGNFGIVTAFHYRLHQVGPIVYGGLLISAPERAGEILRFMREYMPTAPDDLGAAVAFISAPSEPFVPPEMHFRPVVGVVVCWTGDDDHADAIVGPIRAAASPLVDMVQPMPYTALQGMLDAAGPKGVSAYMKADLIADLGDEALDKLARHGAARPGPMTQLLLEPLGGAVGRVGEHDTALGRRDAGWCYHALALWMDPDEATAEAHLAWARDLSDDLRPHTMPGVYLNYTSDEGEEAVLSAYGREKYARLVAIKDAYDPGNLFRLNQNVRPSAGA